MRSTEIEDSIMSENQLADELAELMAEPTRVEASKAAPDPEPAEPDTPEAAEPEPAPAEATPDPVAELLARHEGDPEAALRALHEQHVNAQQTIGRQGQELGGLRKLREQMDAVQQRLDQNTQAQQDQQPQVPLVDEQTVSALDDLAERNPHQAALWALQNNQQMLYERVMETWFETNPRDASRFETQLAVLQARQQLHEEINPTLQSAQAREQAEQNVNVLGQAWADVAARTPDIDNHAQDIIEALKASPEDQQTLKDGSLRDRQIVLENLYWRVRSEKQGTAVAAATEAQAAQQQQAEQQRRQAQVATATTTASRTPARRDPMIDLLDQGIAANASLNIFAEIEKSRQNQ